MLLQLARPRYVLPAWSRLLNKGFKLCIRVVPARGGGNPHIKGEGMLVGNFEFNP